MFMWTTIVNSLSQVADHPMSSPLEDATEEAIRKTRGTNDFSFSYVGASLGKKSG